MTTDALTLAFAARELQERFGRSRLSRVHQPGPREIRLLLRRPQEEETLVLSLDPDLLGVFPASKPKQNPKSAPPFAMLLRKHLEGSRVESFSTVPGERVLVAAFAGRDRFLDERRYRLVLEAFGPKADLYLVGDDDVIMAALRALRLQAGDRYTPPPPTLPEIDGPCPPEALAPGPFLKKEVAHRLTQAAPDDVARVLRQAWLGAGQPTLVKGRRLLAYPIDPTHVPGSRTWGERLLPLLGQVYRLESEARAFAKLCAGLERTLRGALKKLLRKAENQAAELLEASAHLDDRHLGDLIYQNLYLLTHPTDETELTDWAAGSVVRVALDPTLSPQQNAQRYFKRYAKAKSRLDRLTVERNRVLDEARMIEGLLYDLDQAEGLEDAQEVEALARAGGLAGIPKAKGAPPGREVASPLTYATLSGATVLVGKNARQNDEVTFRRAQPGDLWFHVKDLPGSHVILKPGAGPLSDGDIEEAALLAAYHSKGRASSNVPVDITQRRHVRKPRGAVAGFVHYTGHHTRYVTPTPERMAPLLQRAHP